MYSSREKTGFRNYIFSQFICEWQRGRPGNWRSGLGSCSRNFKKFQNEGRWGGGGKQVINGEHGVPLLFFAV